jgi:terminase small subunit / prophage DNA-packing protein
MGTGLLIGSNKQQPISATKTVETRDLAPAFSAITRRGPWSHSTGAGDSQAHGFAIYENSPGCVVVFMSQEKADYWLNKGQMAKSLGISVQAFDKWGVAPISRSSREAFYDVRSVLDNRLAHAQPKHNDDDEDDNGLEYERYRLTRAQADNMELKNEIAKGKTAPIEIIQIVLSKVAGEAAGEIDSIPLNVRRKHPQLDNQIIEDIKRHCVKAQNAVSRADEVLDETLNDYLANLDAN